MAEQVSNTLENQQLAANFDLDEISSPLDAMGAFNIEELDKQGAEPSQDPPIKKKPVVTMADLDKDYQKQVQMLKSLGQVGIPQMAEQSRNKLQAARVVEFDAKKSNIDRYLGYGKSTFNKVGFSPFVDNEKVFNQNTSIWQDFGRMSSVFGSLAYEGGVSGYRSIGSLLSGDSFFNPDDETAENFAKLQNIGMSSKGGIGGFTNNFLLNSAYTVGIGVSILAEEAAMFGLTVATEGAFGGVAAMRTAANVGRFGRAVNQAFKTNSIVNVSKGSIQLVKSLSKVGDAKDFYNSIKTGSYLLGKGTLQFVNPLTRTTDDVIDIYRGTASVRNMSNLAKAKQTFGSFYRDARDMNLALSESKLEGGSAKLDRLNELLYNYEKTNGKPAEGADLERIYQEAEDVGQGVTAVNFPIIYMTNRVVLDGLFKFRGFNTLDEAANLSTKGIGFKKGVGFYDALSGSWVKNTAKSLTNPKAYFGRGVSYFRRNVTEGIQENLQNVTSDAVTDYYAGVYKDPTLGGFDYASGHAWNAIKEEFTSMRGLETFASGFLMGGLMGKGQNLFLKDVPSIYYKVAQPKKYAEFVANRNKTRQDAIAGLNELYSNPLKYFSSRNESAVVQKHTSDTMNQAEDQGDVKTFQDAKDLKTFDHIFTALDNGTYDNLISSYKEMQKLDEKDLSQFLGIQETSKANDKISEVITRAQEIKARYDAVNEQFKNPFTPNKLKKGTPEFTKEAIAYRAFESAKKTAVASQYGFDRALQRMNGLYSDLSSDRPVSKSSSSDYTVLTDVDVLNDEIALVKNEIKSYEGTTDRKQKEILKAKKKRLENLTDYKEKLEAHLEKQNTVEKEENGQLIIQFSEETVEPLRSSYKSYLQDIADTNNDYVLDNKIDESFVKLLDYYKLNADARNYNKVLNTLLDPANLYRHAERLNSKFTELFDNKEADITERVDRAQRVMEVSELLKALAAQGVMLDPDQLQEFIRTGKRPTTFIDAATLKDIEPGSVKYEAAKAIMDIDNSIREEAPVEPSAEEVKQEPAVTEQKETAVDVGIEPELQIKLEDAFNQYIEETGSDITFEEFVNRSPRAARIKAQFKKAPAQEPAAPVKEEPTVEKTEAIAEPVSEEEKPAEEEVAIPVEVETEKTGSQKAQDLIDSVSSIRELPDLSKADSGPVTIDLIELITTGQAKSKDIVSMLGNKRKELLKNLSPKDIQKGDIVTFIDGRKGFVRSVNNAEVKVKVSGSPQGVTETITAQNLSKTLSNVEPGKVITMEPTPEIEVNPQDEKEVKASQDTKGAFTQNTVAVKEAGDKAAKAAGTDNLQNLNNLIQNLGCKTGK